LENGTKTNYVTSEFFKVDAYQLNGANTIANDAPFQLVSVINGDGTMNGVPVRKGEHFIICADQAETIFDGNMEIMIATL
jgi:mannose-6-phosphate isomerase